MPDPVPVLASTQEREKWRERVLVLEGNLRALRAEREVLELRRSQIRRELSRTTNLTRAARTAVGPVSPREVTRGRPPTSFP
ncbi:MAG: hypothetical protein ACREB9_00825 [Thermoplasmata archaeon]